MSWERVAWFFIGFDAAMVFVLGMLFFHRPTQRGWLRFLTRALAERGES